MPCWPKNKVKLQLGKEAAGIAPFSVERTPRFTDWAEVYYEHALKKVTRPDRMEDLLRVVLRF